MYGSAVRRFGTWLVLLSALLILSSGLCAVFVLGQGGTGRETPNANAKKSPSPSKRKRPPRKPKSASRPAPQISDGDENTVDKAKLDDPKAYEREATERTYWETIRLSTDPKDFKAYLEKYPNGQFAGLARDNLGKLETAAKPRLKTDSAGRIILGSISGSSDDAAPKPGSKEGKPFGGGNEVWLQLRFQGQVYQVLYERQADARGVPIDIYFYRTLIPPGAPAPEGEAQWSRFVRVPAADSPNPTSVEWWHATWVQKGGAWEQVSTKGAQFEVMGSAVTGTPETKSDGANDTAANSAGPGYRVRYQGRIYQTIHRVDTDAGIPIDIYFYPITQPDGTQATQNGEKLWGRFVRKPAADFPTLTSMERWHATWVQRGGVWEQVDTKGAQFEVLGKLP